MVRSSQERLMDMYIADVEQDIADMKEKTASIQTRRDNLLKMKESLALYTKKKEQPFPDQELPVQQDLLPERGNPGGYG